MYTYLTPNSILGWWTYWQVVEAWSKYPKWRKNRSRRLSLSVQKPAVERDWGGQSNTFPSHKASFQADLYHYLHMTNNLLFCITKCSKMLFHKKFLCCCCPFCCRCSHCLLRKIPNNPLVLCILCSLFTQLWTLGTITQAHCPYQLITIVCH